MNSRTTIQLMLVATVAAVVAACSPASSGMGPDSSSGSQASTVTWSDNQPAIAISCNQPGG